MLIFFEIFLDKKSHIFRRWLMRSGHIKLNHYQSFFIEKYSRYFFFWGNYIYTTAWTGRKDTRARLISNSKRIWSAAFLRETQEESLGPRGLSGSLLCRDRAQPSKTILHRDRAARWMPNWESEPRTAAEGTFLNENSDENLFVKPRILIRLAWHSIDLRTKSFQLRLK